MLGFYYAPDTALSDLHILTQFLLVATHEVSTIIMTPILQMQELRQSKVN